MKVKEIIEKATARKIKEKRKYKENLIRRWRR